MRKPKKEGEFVRFAVNDDGWSDWTPAIPTFQNNTLHIAPAPSPWSDGVTLDDVEIDFEHNVYWTLHDGDYYIVHIGVENKNELGRKLGART